MAEEEKKAKAVEDGSPDVSDETSREEAEEAPAEKTEEKPTEEKAEKKDEKKEEKQAKAVEDNSPDVSDETSREEEPEELSQELEELAKKYEKFISGIEKLSVVELAELVKVLEKKFGVSAAAPVAAAGAAGAEVEEKDSFDIMLKSGGGQKISVIKAVKEITGLGLKDSKDMVEGAPKVIKEGVKKEEAEDFKAKLEEAGATVELQ